MRDTPRGPEGLACLLGLIEMGFGGAKPVPGRRRFGNGQCCCCTSHSLITVAAYLLLVKKSAAACQGHGAADSHSFAAKTRQEIYGAAVLMTASLYITRAVLNNFNHAPA